MTYTNSFYAPSNRDSKEILSCDTEPIPHGNCLIYQRQKEVFDIVKDGVCIGMYAGINGAKFAIDNGTYAA